MTTSTIDTSRGLHVRYEKSGLILDALPVPASADVVIVEANIKIAKVKLEKHDFVLQAEGDTEPTTAEVIVRDNARTSARIYFRIPTPKRSVRVAIRWREHSLGEITIPIQAAGDFLKGCTLRHACLHAKVKETTVACKTIVQGQCQSLSASAVIVSPGSLASLADYDLHLQSDLPGVDFHGIPVGLTRAQLSVKETLLTVPLPKPKRMGDYRVSWQLDTHRLHECFLRVISKKKYMRSLRVSATRFVVKLESGEMRRLRWLPTCDGEPNLDGIVEAAPCFFISSSELAIAGWTRVTLGMVDVHGETSPNGSSQDLVITDGATPFMPVTLTSRELRSIKHFTLATELGTIGTLPLVPAPTAQFNAEGAFEGNQEFLWSAAADEQLNEKLDHLLGGG